MALSLNEVLATAKNTPARIIAECGSCYKKLVTDGTEPPRAVLWHDPKDNDFMKSAMEHGIVAFLVDCPQPGCGTTVRCKSHVTVSDLMFGIEHAARLERIRQERIARS